MINKSIKIRNIGSYKTTESLSPQKSSPELQLQKPSNQIRDQHLQAGQCAARLQRGELHLESFLGVSFHQNRVQVLHNGHCLPQRDYIGHSGADSPARGRLPDLLHFGRSCPGRLHGDFLQLYDPRLRGVRGRADARLRVDLLLARQPAAIHHSEQLQHCGVRLPAYFVGAGVLQPGQLGDRAEDEAAGLVGEQSQHAGAQMLFMTLISTIQKRQDNQVLQSKNSVKLSMIANASPKVSKDRVFTVLHEIDLKVGKIKRKGIVFVGMSRVGKSTAYNWTIKHPLEAKAEEIVRPTIEKKVQVPVPSTGRKRRAENDSFSQSYKPLISTSVTYVPRIIQSETGQVRSGIKSCTLVPNIFDLDSQTTLLDMAGYGDSRDYIGTLGVSYSQRAVFEVLQEVKFIIVVTEHILKNTKLLCDTLNHFFGMFNLQKYPKIEEKIFEATSLLITQSVDYMKYYDLIEEARNQLQDSQLQNIDNRELIADFLKYINWEVNRFREFKMAKLGQPPEQCKFIEEFDRKGWKYFNLKDTRKQVMKSPQDPDIIKLPFQKQFLSMKTSDQQALMACIDNRLKSYRIISSIFEKIYDGIFAEGSLNDIKLLYGSFFASIETFLSENDHYESKKYIDSHSLTESQFIKPQRETLFYLLLKIKNILIFSNLVLGSSKQQIKPTMDLFSARITQLIELISVIFCRNRDDCRLMMRLKFILLRGIRQFYMLLHVSHEKVSSCVNVIHDSFQCIFPSNQKGYWQNFLLSFKLNPDERIDFDQKNQQNYMQKYIKTRENAFALEVLFMAHQRDIMTLKSQLIDRYYQILRDVKLVHARHQFQKYEHRKCLIYLHDALTLQMKVSKNASKRMNKGYGSKAQELQRKEQQMMLSQENILQLIKLTYIKMNNFQMALIISETLNWVHSTCEIYEVLLADKGKANRKIIQEYAVYCMDHGLPEKGRALFHRLLEIQKSFERKKEILKQIQSYLQQQLLLTKTKQKILRDRAFSGYLRPPDRFQFSGDDLYIQNSQNPTQVYYKFINQGYFIRLNDTKRQNLLKAICQSLKEDNNNTDKIIDSIRHRFNDQVNNSVRFQPQQILGKYLQERDESQSLCAANDFKVNYNQFVQNIPIFVINNAEQIKKFDIWMIQQLEIFSKLGKNDLKGKQVRIDVKKISSLSISEKTLIITLEPQRTKRTFEYAVKIMKAVKKLIYEQHDKLLMVIKLAHETIQKTDVEIRDHLLEEYRDSITKEEIQAIKSIIQKMPKADSQAIEAEYRKLYKEPRLVRSELASIFDYIRQKNCEEIYREVKQKMMEMSNAKDHSSEMDCTRDYY